MQTPIDGLFDGRQRIFWLYLLVSSIVALAVTLVRGKRPGFAHLKYYFWNSGARLDYRYFLVNWAVRTALIAPLILSARTVALWTLNGLERFAEPLFLRWRYRDIVLCYTLTLFIVGDFSRYLLHRLMHNNSWLWLFHKVHHSATSLNPLTFYRLHPVENLFYALRYALVTGVVTGGFIFCFGARLDLYSIFGGNIFVVLLFAFTSNLRHSHIRLSYGYILEHLLISPAQHQIHHLTRHMRSNLGSCLALWDWLFGTLKCARDVPHITGYGLGREGRHYDSVAKIMRRPFLDITRRLRRRKI